MYWHFIKHLAENFDDFACGLKKYCAPFWIAKTQIIRKNLKALIYIEGAVLAAVVPAKR